jgi:hypothetical protein
VREGIGTAPGDGTGGDPDHRDAREKLTIRRAKRADFLTFFGDETKHPTSIAWCGEIDGEIVGIGGFVTVAGTNVAFLDLTEKARKHKVALARAGYRAMELVKKSGKRYIFVEVGEPGAERWLRRLGFEPYQGRVWKWRKSQH